MQRQETIRRHEASWIGGLVLMAVGLLMLATYLVPNISVYTVLILGIVFLAAFVYTRHYAFLVPGGILTGLGLGILAMQVVSAEEMAAGALVVGGLALGFLAIWLIAALLHLEESHPWPLVPAAILGVVAVFLAIGRPEALQIVSVLVAIAMILGGGWLMLRRRATG